MANSHAVVEMSEIQADLKDAQNGTEKKNGDDSAAKSCDITEHSMPHPQLAELLTTSLDKGMTKEGK